MGLSNFSKNSTEAGFTLVEIAIVLVIIGLLLGGVLKGQEMITQAKIKNIVNDFNGITVAVTSYQDRYRALPGDDQNATTRWTTQAPGKGNGDGVMLGKYKDNDTTGTGGAPADLKESNLFWQHLRIAGFVPGLTTGTGSGTPPPNAAGGLIGVVMVFRDISEQRRRERAVQDALAYAEGIIDTVRDPLIVLDATGTRPMRPWRPPAIRQRRTSESDHRRRLEQIEEKAGHHAE